MPSGCDAQGSPEFLCLVTNAAYAPGACCLAQSLELVGSRARLTVIATSRAAEAALHVEAAASPKPPPMDVVFEDHALPESSGAATHSGSGAVLSVDAPRRTLFDGARRGFVLLAPNIQNFDGTGNGNHLDEILILMILELISMNSIIKTKLFGPTNTKPRGDL